jgi:hypothetical protein
MAPVQAPDRSTASPRSAAEAPSSDKALFRGGWHDPAVAKDEAVSWVSTLKHATPEELAEQANRLPSHAATGEKLFTFHPSTAPGVGPAIPPRHQAAWNEGRRTLAETLPVAKASELRDTRPSVKQLAAAGAFRPLADNARANELLDAPRRYQGATDLIREDILPRKAAPPSQLYRSASSAETGALKAAGTWLLKTLKLVK